MNICWSLTMVCCTFEFKLLFNLANFDKGNFDSTGYGNTSNTLLLYTNNSH
jgi:hypothetical protein